ncbi:unnamed protein product [Calypogeia fissa]
MSGALPQLTRCKDVIYQQKRISRIWIQ